MIGYVLGLIGIWVLQDAIASICFYPNENWQWNHWARMVRAIMGAVLVVLGWIILLDK